MTVQLQNIAGSGSDVQRVHVLRSKRKFRHQCFQLDQRPMPGVRLGRRACRDALVVPAPNQQGVTRKTLRGRKIFDAMPLPVAVLTAKRGQAAFSRDTGSGEHEHGARVCQNLHECIRHGGCFVIKPGDAPGEAKEQRVDEASRLMQRVRARDADAFETLYDGYHRLVYGVALRMLGDAASAEDVTQGVFLKIWSSPNVFQSGNFAGWVVRVTRNRALDVLRSKARSHDELPETIPDDDRFEERAFAKLDAVRVRAALAQLPADQRDPIELGFFGGITHEEIARRYDLPLGTVKTRIRSGLRRLRAALEGGVAV